ncbi:fasciclin domain-containing protein [Marivirga salinae]|uniref:Fasciclin domain-containing protein n=1 Tax=Marivirga salinarum TaxID=3059078 RepID=A0AA51NBA1_9BACT|nr:fasciclin domain-containing protein [Marivirga sp. BDSF4-3]WMN11844.1 fasciclin domain-containing protein [Marivirga sp. BDSF4-3]
MKRRDVILFVGIIVASIIGTKTFAEPLRKHSSEEIGAEEVERIIKTIKNNPEFSIFYNAIEEAELSKEIAKLDKMTLMIPSNKAFRLLPEDVWENFMDEDNKEDLVKLLNYHVIPEKVNFDDLNRADNLETLQNQSVKIFKGEDLKIENAVVQEKHEETSDVIIYKIDRLIMPL